MTHVISGLKGVVREIRIPKGFLIYSSTFFAWTVLLGIIEKDVWLLSAGVFATSAIAYATLLGGESSTKLPAISFIIVGVADLIAGKPSYTGLAVLGLLVNYVSMKVAEVEAELIHPFAAMKGGLSRKGV